MLDRIGTLIVKELRALVRSPQSRMLLLMPVFLQIAIFPLATTLEVRNSTLAVYNEDAGAASIELIQRLAAARAFPRLVMVHDDAGLRRTIDEQRALLAVRVPRDFSRRLARNEVVTLQVIIDGRRSNAAQIAFGYVRQMVRDYAGETGATPMPATLSVRNLYNPNLEYSWFVLPSLVAIITTIGCLMVTAMSLAREREEGTFDQLLVTPLTTGQIMIGKAVPGIAIALAQGSVIAGAAVWVYDVPLTGALWLLYVSMFCYALSLAGVGLFISALCASQQQAFLGVFFFIVPAVVLSGYLGPVENMPPFLQGLSQANPLTHFIVISKGVFLKQYTVDQIWPNLWPLLLIAVATLGSAFAMFRWRST